MVKEWSSQKISTEFLCVNSCGTEVAHDRDIPTYRPSGRVDYHILYVQKGACRLEKSGKVQNVSAGNVILFRPLETQKYCFLSDQQSVSQYIHFTGEGCENLLQRFLPQGRSVFFVGNSTSCEMVLERMAQEVVFKRPFWEQASAAYLFQLLALIGRKLCYAVPGSGPWPEKRIEQICYRLHQEYQQNIPLSHYAADCCLSLSRFSHLFKQSVGVSPGAYRNALRIEKAKKLLLFTDLTVSDISELIGCCDSNYFTRMFKADVGYTPTQYRKKA